MPEEETQDQQDHSDAETPDKAETPDNAETPEQAEGDKLPENVVTVEDCGTLKKKVTITISRVRIDAKFDEMFGELGNTAQVPGFRIGRAPRRLIEKRFGKEVGEDVRRALIGESLGQAIEKTELKVLGEPDVDTEAIKLPDAGDLEYSFEVEIAPEFELPEIKGIGLEKPVIEITSERVDQTLQQWREAKARYEASEEPAVEGDMVTADATISGDGIDETKHPGLKLRVAPGQIEGLPLVDLGKAISGTKAGETAELSVKVPDAHPNEQWRGKDLKIAVHVSQVSRRVLPELNDEFARSYGLDSLEQFRAEMRRNLEASVEREQLQALRDQVCKYLLDNTKLDVPQGAVARNTAGILRRRYVDLLQRGVTREKIDENLTELQAAAGEQAVMEMKLSFILDKICREQDIQVSEEEINSRIAEMARQYNRRPERLRQELAADGSLEQVAVALKESKALDKLMAEAEVKEVSPEPAGEPAEEPAGQKTARKASEVEPAEAKKAAQKTVKKKAAKKAVKKAGQKTAQKASEAEPAEAKTSVKKSAQKTAKKPGEKSQKKTAKKSAKKADKKDSDEK